MGGRGASSGMSVNGKLYGTEYHTLLQDGNIKFVAANEGAPTAPLETMTKGRVYVTVNEKENSLKSITFYDRNNKRFKQIDLDHFHKINGKAEKPHVQMGYFHNGMASTLSDKDKRLIDRVIKKWYTK